MVERISSKSLRLFNFDGLGSPDRPVVTATLPMRLPLPCTELEYAANDTSWMIYGRCFHVTELMYSHECKSSCKAKKPCDDDEQVIQAKYVCSSCPVLPQCRFWAVVTAEPYGVSGAMTSTERRKLRKQLRRAGFDFDYYKGLKPNGSEETTDD